ncbi:stalk domain-containing protein [Paenibacillus macerans]|uniref:stalk domain-containing protein n=1 Tax=Paenibacillus macerans TaxID=44252 RepID=UPI003D318A79
MRKWLWAGVLTLTVGLVVATGAGADSVSLIGKKVQAVVSFEVNGKAVKDAVIINGVTYVPARSFSEAAGYSVAIEGGKVKMFSSDDKIAETLNNKWRISVLQQNIVTLETEIEGYKEEVKQAETAIKEAEALNAKTSELTKIDTSGVEEKLRKAKASIAETQAKIDAANAEIAELQAKIDAN